MHLNYVANIILFSHITKRKLKKVSKTEKLGVLALASDFVDD